MNKHTHSEDAELDQIFKDFRMNEINRFSISSKPVGKLSTCLSKLKIDALSERAMHLGIENTFKKKSELAEEISSYFQAPGHIEALISWANEDEELDRVGIKFNSRNDIDQFMKHYKQAVNHTRIWINHGHTPIELRELYTENVHVPIKKVGRNEPCPCGSGKSIKSAVA